MGYSFSYYDYEGSMSDTTGRPVIHEFGPLLAGENRYHDKRRDLWLSGEELSRTEF